MNKKIIYLVKFAKIAFGEFGSNNCSYMAAAIAYWMLLSIFPLILAAMSLIGFLYPDVILNSWIFKLYRVFHECLSKHVHQSTASIVVPVDDNDPPVPCTIAIFGLCNWRFPVSPRSCLTASNTRNMPYIPE